MPRSVVSGGAGFIGSNLVDRLVDDGHEVFVIDDLSSGSLANLADSRRRGSVVLHQIDVSSREVVDLVRSFQPDNVFHLAAQIDVRHSVADPVHDAKINILGTINMLEAARHGNAERFVFSSSGGATFGDTFNIPTPETQKRVPESPYGVSKYVVEEYFRYYKDMYDLDYVSLGFANVYGPRQDPHGEAGVVAMGLPREYYRKLAEFYKHKRDVICAELANVGFRTFVPKGAYYVLTDFTAISDVDDTQFAIDLVEKIGVAAVPGSSFYSSEARGRSKVRFAFCKTEETLREAIERLERIP